VIRFYLGNDVIGGLKRLSEVPRKRDCRVGQVKENTSQLKQQAAERAVAFVKSGMVVGLGHGSTAIFAVRCLAQLLREGQLRDILGVPCSRQVEEDTRRLGIPLTTLDEHPVLI
jgi:ribose 5-phosphate isomerase